MSKKKNMAGIIQINRHRSAVDAEIIELERLLQVLPPEYSGRWCDFYLHRQIKAQLGVLQTGMLPVGDGRPDAADAALWAAQWLEDVTYRDDQGPSEEWRQFEQDIKSSAPDADAENREGGNQ